MAWVARGKCEALGTKKSSTPAVVPGAAPALAKAGSADIDLYRGAHKTFRQELPMSVPEELSYKHQRRGSSRS